MNLQLDIDRFKQIMVNLLGNSIRYTEAGGEVRVHTEAMSHPLECDRG